MFNNKYIQRIEFEIFEILETLFSIVPGTFGMYGRKIIYKLFLNKCGKWLNIGLRVKIQRPSNVFIGNGVSINYGVWMAANNNPNGNIYIGNNVLIRPYSILHSGNHNFKDPNKIIYKQGFSFSNIVIEDDVWIAARCTILSGVTIGKGSVIAAGSVITKNIPPYSVVAGVPGTVISKRE